ncbi:hypothetical protein F443_18704 [Phytophthora nicotianae P1569]|uniref:Uncharacterized protein n=1 Tax=Phytophthora nicotianae P1569 TaxID=1317065 RepID=V9E7D6_PHYNI|nr:hypothetical protein F443_18704 [Phytophthora nicotianae P1569]
MAHTYKGGDVSCSCRSSSPWSRTACREGGRRRYSGYLISQHAIQLHVTQHRHCGAGQRSSESPQRSASRRQSQCDSRTMVPRGDSTLATSESTRVAALLPCLWQKASSNMSTPAAWAPSTTRDTRTHPERLQDRWVGIVHTGLVA